MAPTGENLKNWFLPIKGQYGARLGERSWTLCIGGHTRGGESSVVEWLKFRSRTKGGSVEKDVTRVACDRRKKGDEPDLGPAIGTNTCGVSVWKSGDRRKSQTDVRTRWSGEVTVEGRDSVVEGREDR